MKTNQTLTAVCSAVVLSIITSSAALASSGTTSKGLISGPLILLFLGFCAMVVVIQCVPAIITLYGMLSGAASSKEKDSAAAKH